MRSDEGCPTFHGRVESWECDFNGHWNTRFYCRSFQTAAQVAAALDGRSDPGSVVVTGRHMRFHRELLCNESFTIGSFDLASDHEEPVTVHRMYRQGQTLATCLDYGLARNGALSPMPPELNPQVWPRGLGDAVVVPDKITADRVFELGPVRNEELQAGGALEFNACVVRLGPISHHHMTRLGFTRDFTTETGIGRMLVEMRFTRLGPCAPNDFLRGSGHLVAASGKSFTTANLIYTHRGTPVALFETCLLAVDLGARRATDLPDFIIQAAP